MRALGLCMYLLKSSHDMSFVYTMLVNECLFHCALRLFDIKLHSTSSLVWYQICFLLYTVSNAVITVVYTLHTQCVVYFQIWLNHVPLDRTATIFPRPGNTVKKAHVKVVCSLMRRSLTHNHILHVVFNMSWRNTYFQHMDKIFKNPAGSLFGYRTRMC